MQNISNINSKVDFLCVGENKSWSDIGKNDTEGIKKRHSWLLRMYKKYGKGGYRQDEKI